MKRVIKETYIFFPLMILSESHEMKHGTIGPVSKLQNKFDKLLKVAEGFEVKVNGMPIDDPVFAVSQDNFDKFISEMECLRFCLEENKFDLHEIFCVQSLVTLEDDENKECICFDKSQYLYFNDDFKREFKRDYYYSLEFIRLDKQIEDTINSDLNIALVKCLESESDHEYKKEKARIIISIMLINQESNMIFTQPFSNIRIVLLASAFEALLNLPENTVSSTFQHSISLLMGKKTSLLKKWCNKFYEYRSDLVHGEIDWNNLNFDFFDIPGKDSQSYVYIARKLFIHCLKIKLYLMGLNKNYKREEFSLIDF